MSSKFQVFYVLCDADLKRRVKAEAAARGIDMAVLVREALEVYLDGGGRKVARSDRKSSSRIRYEPIRE